MCKYSLDIGYTVQYSRLACLCVCVRVCVCLCVIYILTSEVGAVVGWGKVSISKRNYHLKGTLRFRASAG